MPDRMPLPRRVTVLLVIGLLAAALAGCWTNTRGFGSANVPPSESPAPAGPGLGSASLLQDRDELVTTAGEGASLQSVPEPVMPATPRAANQPDQRDGGAELTADSPAQGADDELVGVLDEAPADVSCERPTPPPLPVPGSPGSAEFWQAFRQPLPPTAIWNPPGRKRVGLQVGHWRLAELPAELSRLEGGSAGGGRSEWEVNLDLARRAAGLLTAAEVDVDLLPAAVPIGYRAHAFLAIHADGDASGVLRGYKLARAGISATPAADDHLLEALYETYGEDTGLPRDDLHISRRMTAYYAFNSRRYCHAVAPGVPAAILEAGFLTSAIDRELLIGNPDAAARGISRGLLRFLGLA